jgi:hypothetical protein
MLRHQDTQEDPCVWQIFYAVDAAQLMAAQNAKDAKRATKQNREEFRTSAHLSKGCALNTFVTRAPHLLFSKKGKSTFRNNKY